MGLSVVQSLGQPSCEARCDSRINKDEKQLLSSLLQSPPPPPPQSPWPDFNWWRRWRLQQRRQKLFFVFVYPAITTSFARRRCPQGRERERHLCRDLWLPSLLSFPPRLLVCGRREGRGREERRGQVFLSLLQRVGRGLILQNWISFFF